MVWYYIISLTISVMALLWAGIEFRRNTNFRKKELAFSVFTALREEYKEHGMVDST